MSDKFSSIEKGQQEIFDRNPKTEWDRRPSYIRQTSSSSTTPLFPRHDLSHPHQPIHLPNNPQTQTAPSSSSANGTRRCSVIVNQYVEYDGVDLEKDIQCHFESRGSRHVCPLYHGPTSTSTYPYLRLNILLATARNCLRKLRTPRTSFTRNTRRKSDTAFEETNPDRVCSCDFHLNDKLNRRQSIHELQNTTNTTRSSLCGRGSLVMIGSIITFILILYAWNVQVLWGGEMMRGRHDFSMDHGSGRTNGKITKHMVHSHNDEMQGDNALTWALSLSVGSIEVDTWLSPAPLPSLASSTVSSLIGRALRPRVPTPLALGLSSSEEILIKPHVEKKVEMDGLQGLAKRTPTADPGMVLLTGHKVKDLTKHTLKAFYLDPLLDRLEKNNEDRIPGDKIIGLDKDDPDAETQLVIDMKSDGDMTWPYLMAALKPLLDKGYLTTFDTTTQTWNRSAIMIVGTGNSPIHQVYYQSPRVIFYDAPLKTLSQTVKIPLSNAGPATTFEWDNTIAPMASSKFPVIYHIALALPPWNPIATQLRAYTKEAAKRGIQSRWWGSTRRPAWARRRMWEMQKQGGVDWINADDLADAVDWVEEWDSR